MPEQLKGPSTAGEAEPVRVERKGAVLTIVLSRPQRLNAFDEPMINAFDAAIRAAAESDAAAIVITGEGRAFSAGGDRDTLAAQGSLDDQVDTLVSKGSVVARISALPQVTIAAINGACAGSAIGIAGACDLRYAADRAIFNTAYVTLGLSGDYGVADALTRAIGPGAALDWLLRPRKITAQHAAEAGFVQDVFPNAGFAAALQEIATRIAAIPAAVRIGVKANVADAVAGSEPLLARLRTEAARHTAAKHAASATPALASP